MDADERKARLHNNLHHGLSRNQNQNQATLSHDDSSLSSCERSRLTTISSQNPLVMTKRSSLARSYSDRTNKMLLAVLLLFLVTEFPSGILVFLSGIFGEKFFQDVYSPLGELYDILALVNSSINFILYCTTSSVFRQTFCKLFCPCFPSHPVLQTTRTTTIEPKATIVQLKSQESVHDTPI